MPGYDATLEIVRELVAHHLPEPRAVEPSDHLQHDLGFDSLAVMEVVADFEDRFRVTLGPELLDRVHTIDDVVKVLVELSPDA